MSLAKQTPDQQGKPAELWMRDSKLPNQKLLLITSDELLRQDYRQVFTKAGFEVLTAKSAEEAMPMVFQHFPVMILGDLQLPDLNGYQLCRILKNDPLVSGIPFLLISEFDENINRFWGFKSGNDGFIDKSAGVQVALTEVKTVLELFDHTLRESLPLSPKINPANLESAMQLRFKQMLDKALMESTLMNEFRALSDLTQDISLLNHLLFSLLESVITYDAAAIYFKAPRRMPQQVTFHISKPEDILPYGFSSKVKPSQEPPITQATLSQLQHYMFENIEHTNVRPLNPSMPTQSELSELVPPEVIGQIQPAGISSANGELRFAEKSDFASTYLRPFYHNNELIGGLALFSRSEIHYEHIFPIKLIEQELQRLMNQRHLACQAETYFLSDPLTGLYNYRYFMAMLEKEFIRAQRYKVPMSLVLINVDELKSYNDNHGYLLGDEILRQTAQFAIENFRNVDVIARFSGKEIVALMPETDLDNARIGCERLRQAVERNPLLWKEHKIQATISLGLATLRHGEETASDLLSRASDALYMAKKKGRNRIETALG